MAGARPARLACLLVVGVLVAGGALAPVASGAAQGTGPSATSVTTAGSGADSGSGAAGETGPATAQSDSLVLTSRLSLTPDRPGEVRAATTFAIPDGVRTLTARLPPGSTVRSTDGFVRRSDREFDWDGTTERPAITFDFPANESVSGGEGSDRSGYLYVDAGDWALVERPGVEVQFAGTGERPAIERRLATVAGVAGTDLAYLGPYEHHERRAAGQRIRLVVPARADMAASPSAVLDSVGDAARRLAVGDRDETVLFVAAPTTVDWGTTGLQVGDRDAWVRDVQRLDHPQNVWVHEYVHTRQDHRTTAATRWTAEGFAEYYAALLTLRQDRIDFETFRGHLERGGEAPYGDAVMADPDTWSGSANYWKGALVAGAVDHRLRRAGDGDLDRVFARMNADPDGVVNASAFLAAVRAVGDDEVAAFAREHVETAAVPATWNRSEHAETFGGLALVETSVRGYRVTGPYRNATTARPPTLVPGETLTARVRVTNTGDEPGDYAVALEADGETVEEASGSLAAGESRTVELAWTPSTTGDVTLSVAGREVGVAVRGPAAPRVTNLSAIPATVAPRETVAVTVAVANPADRPADGTVTLRADGEAVREQRVRLAPGGETTVSAVLRFGEPGEHTVAAGDRSAVVRVSTEATPVTVTPTAPDGSTGDGGGANPGDGPATPTAGSGPLGPVAALVAVAVALATGVWRSRARR